MSSLIYIATFITYERGPEHLVHLN